MSTIRERNAEWADLSEFAPEPERDRHDLLVALDRLVEAASADDLWLGVELLGINGVTFSEPMVSASGARAAIRAIVAQAKEVTG